MSQSIILTDLDNTIYNWKDFFAPSFRAMVHVLSKETGIHEDEIINDFKKIYNDKGSPEYAFSVQELKMCHNLPIKKVDKLVYLAKAVFSRTRQKNLIPYNGVKKTLEWGIREGIKIIGVTNSPIFHAQRRLRKLNLDHLFFGLAGWEGHEVPDEDNYGIHTIKQRIKEKSYHSRVQKLWPLPTEELKPNSIGYLEIINDLHISCEKTYVVGDSLWRDIKPALEIGAIGVWAKYGRECKPKSFETLLKLDKWSEEKILNISDPRLIKPPLIINNFSEIQKFIQPHQLKLPI